MIEIKKQYLDKIEEIFSGNPYEITYNDSECLYLFAHILEVKQLEKENITETLIELLLKLPRESFVGWVCYLSTTKIKMSDEIIWKIFNDESLVKRMSSIMNSIDREKFFEWGSLYVADYKNEFEKRKNEIEGV